MSLANNNSRGQNNVSISKYTMKDTSEGHTYGNLCFKYAEYICTMSHITISTMPYGSDHKG